MCVLVNAELKELEIRATHRLLTDADRGELRALVDGTDADLHAAPMPAQALSEAVAAAETPAFGLVTDEGGWLLRVDPDAAAERLARERSSTAVRRLDLSLLHAAILDDRLGITAGDVAAGERLAYTRDAGEALDRVRRGEVRAAILVRPTQLDQLAAVANAGDVMPQKSTYFYPKLLTGMVFHPLGGTDDS